MQGVARFVSRCFTQMYSYTYLGDIQTRAPGRRGELSGMKRNRIRFQTRLSLMTWKYKSDPYSPSLPSPPFPFSFPNAVSRGRHEIDIGNGRRGKVSEFLATSRQAKVRGFRFRLEISPAGLPDFPPAFGLHGESLLALTLFYLRFEAPNKRTDFFRRKPRLSLALSRSFRPPRAPFLFFDARLYFPHREFSFLCRKLRREGEGREWNGMEARKSNFSERKRNKRVRDRRRRT